MQFLTIFVCATFAAANHLSQGKLTTVIESELIPYRPFPYICVQSFEYSKFFENFEDNRPSRLYYSAHLGFHRTFIGSGVAKDSAVQRYAQSKSNKTCHTYKIMTCVICWHNKIDILIGIIGKKKLNAFPTCVSEENVERVFEPFINGMHVNTTS